MGLSGYLRSPDPIYFGGYPRRCFWWFGLIVRRSQQARV